MLDPLEPDHGIVVDHLLQRIHLLILLDGIVSDPDETDIPGLAGLGARLPRRRLALELGALRVLGPRNARRLTIGGLPFEPAACG